MDQYVTTYRKDFTWPSKSLHVDGTTRVIGVSRTSDACDCGGDPSVLKVSKEQSVPRKGDSHDWSRLGPMGRLLDPKVYPAKTGPYPESASTRFDQPSTYLKKLEEKYPNIYGVLKSASMKEVTARVDADRMKTTYQVDFDETGKSAAVETKETAGPCVSTEPARIDCRAHVRASLPKRDRSSKDAEEMRKKNKKSGGKSGRKDEDMDGPDTRLPAWRSEYQDGISKIGQAIIRGKIHYTKKKTSPAWAMAN